MRLVELTVRNFRGFGSKAETIRLDRDLVLFFGPNGFGKTSLAEAIEWLFYGFTKRRRQGDGYSKAEHAGTYANDQPPSSGPDETSVHEDNGGRG